MTDHSGCELLGPGPNDIGFLELCFVDDAVKWHPSDTPEGYWLVVSVDRAYQILAASGLENAYDLYRRDAS